MFIHPIVAGSLALLLAAPGAEAFQVRRLSPQGEAAQVRQLVVQFDEAAVPAGDPAAAAPLALQCNNAQATRGSGRWNNEREWAFDFENDLPPGVACTVQLRPGLQSVRGTALAGPSSYRFNTGGPFVLNVRPYPGTPIDEEQYFSLQLNGAATPASVLANVWCAVDGLGERVPVRLVEGADRAAFLKSQNLQRRAAASPQAVVTLACNRRLSPSARVQLVYGAGVAAPAVAGSPAGGLANRLEKRFSYQVREPFSASLRCERENAQAACLPIRPIGLDFNGPVTRALAERIRLVSASGEVKPVLEPATGAPDDVVQGLSFAPPFAEQARFTLTLPPGFQDASARSLRNAASFPLQVATGAMPPLAKFAAAPFGIVERFAEPDGVALLPVTLRKVEAALQVRSLAPAPAAAPAQVRDLRPASDADIIAWFTKVQRYDAFSVPRSTAAADVAGPLPGVVDADRKDEVQSRMVSLLQGRAGVTTLQLPATAPADPRPFEVVGIPLTPGFHVLEIASPVLGAALLDPRHGSPRSMYVRSSALVTNLAVHFKLGRDNALAWVTTLDKGQPVAQASVRVSDCRGREIARASTNAQGLAVFSGIAPEAPSCADDNGGTQAYFVSARAMQPGAGSGSRASVEDLAFTWSDWHRGIEPWRYNVPTSRDALPDLRAHTIFDRSLLRAGDTLSMKHLLRTETGGGFGLPDAAPSTLVVTHVGSGQQSTQPLAWRRTATGGQSAESTFAVPVAARLGLYQVELRGTASERTTASGQFRVEAFRLPVLQGSVLPADKAALVNRKTVPVDVSLHYVSGGPAANLPVQLSALVRHTVPAYPDFGQFSFAPPRGEQERGAGSDEEDNNAAQGQRVVADKLPLALDRNGGGRLVIDPLPPAQQPRELLLEASYADPNGELQTLRSTHTLWPAAVVAGIKTEDWVSTGQKARFQALALDPAGKPRAGVPLDVRAVARTTTSSRKRMVGGFYAYDNRTDVKELGSVCSGKSNSQGLLLCEATLGQPGEVELVATARDDAGNSSQAAASVYVTRQGELWFGGENHDRMEVLPEQRAYQPGDTARFQVRMPFRAATALVAVEREGVLESHTVQLRGDDPTITLKVQDSWGPNVYVSVLALRGRLREVPWYSFFTWGYKAPGEWWTSFWYDGRAYTAPTTLVDLSKPAFRLGMAEIRVGSQAHRLDVKVSADQASYPVRGKAVVTIRATLPNGQPAAQAEVALAAVDQALLELMPNTSWNLLEAMLQRRAWGVETSTAQMEIIGRRHYGRKAVPAGGGGGRSGTRELLDTLLLWNPRVQLDANGRARVEVPLNDAISTFQVVAVADVSTGLFGTGQTSIRTTQDLQIISGLPPLVRENDQFRAQFTLRNTTAKPMRVALSARATLLELAPQTVDLPAGEAREVAWSVTAPVQLARLRPEAILWELEARDSASGARDALKVRQRILSAVPLAVQQASLVQLDGPFRLEVQPPVGALPGRGGLQLTLQPTLAGGADGGLPAVRDWFASYPYTCLEQTSSRAIGLRDVRQWQALLAQLPAYLDADGLASYFPPRDGEASRGSDTLTAYLLAASHEASGIDPAFALPEEVRTRMERGLLAFVQGRLARNFWSPRAGGDLEVRKLAALEALSRSGTATGRMTTSITIAPNQWPTHAVIDWLNILRQVRDVPQREQRLAEATQVLRSRIAYQGSKLVFGNEAGDNWWWLMHSGDGNAARLLLAVLDDPAWKDDMGRLANGLVGRQQRGAWRTTTANLWGTLALQKFSARFESQPVIGSTQARSAHTSATVDWSVAERGMFLPWGPSGGAETLDVTHQGGGKPWLTLQSLAAVERTQPFSAGYQIRRSVTAVQQANPTLPAGNYGRGDILRITLEVTAAADMAWVVVSDAVPGGAAILGSGLGRDSQLATQGEKRGGSAWPVFEERSQEAFRAYYDFLPRGTTTLQYTVRLNNVGSFALPPSRVEAMYAPEVFGEAPNRPIQVGAPR